MLEKEFFFSLWKLPLGSLLKCYSDSWVIDRFANKRKLPNRLRLLEDQKIQGESRALERFQTREWKAGDVYAPHDLSPAEMKKWGQRKSPNRDAFDALHLNPLSLYKVRIEWLVL